MDRRQGLGAFGFVATDRVRPLLSLASDRVHPEVVSVMREAGIDLADAKPSHFKPALARCAQVLVTRGCGEVCPATVGLHPEDWGLPDPKGQSIERVREIRDQIRERVAGLVQDRGWSLRS